MLQKLFILVIFKCHSEKPDRFSRWRFSELCIRVVCTCLPACLSVLRLLSARVYLSLSISDQWRDPNARLIREQNACRAAFAFPTLHHTCGLRTQPLCALRSTVKPGPHEQQCRSNVRLCRKTKFQRKTRSTLLPFLATKSYQVTYQVRPHLSEWIIPRCGLRPSGRSVRKEADRCLSQSG